VNTVHPVHIPSHMLYLIAKCRDALHGLEEQLGRSPTPGELGKAAAVSKATVESVRRASGATRAPIRAGAPDDRSDAPTIEAFVDRSRPEETAIRADQLRLVRESLDTMDPRTARGLKLRFGLEGRAPLTHDRGGSRARAELRDDPADRAAGPPPAPPAALQSKRFDMSRPRRRFLPGLDQSGSGTLR